MSEADLDRIGALIELKQFDQARTEITSLLAKNPENGALWFGLAGLEFYQNSPERALESINRALGAGFDPAQALVHKAVVLSEIDANSEETLITAEKALAADPSNVEAHLLLAELLNYREDEPRRAIWHANRARELAPEDPQTHLVLGTTVRDRKSVLSYFPIVSTIEAWWQARKAIKPLEKAAQLAPGKADIIYAQAVNYLRRNRTAHAIRRFATVLQINPHHPMAPHYLTIATGKHLLRLYSPFPILAFLGVYGAAVADYLSPLGFWPEVAVHLVTTAVVGGLAWIFVFRRIFKPFPAETRPRVLLLLRRNPLAKILLIGLLWTISWILALTILPMNEISSGIGTLGMMISIIYYFVMRILMADITKQRDSAWSNLVARKPLVVPKKSDKNFGN